MIGRHPALYGLPELKLFAYPTIGALEDSLPAYWKRRGHVHRSPGLVCAVAEILFGSQSPEAIGDALGWLGERRAWPGARVLDILLERISPMIAVEKSPETTVTDAALARAAEAYPAARYVHLVRHPLTTVDSMIAHWRRRVPERDDDLKPEVALAGWWEVNTRIHLFLSRLEPGRCVRIRAEDLLEGPYGSLGRIAEWLGIACDPASIRRMTRPDKSPFARLPAPSTGIFGGNDLGFLADPVPRSQAMPPARLCRPAWCADEPDLWNAAASLAETFGYR